jgi:hypothetical protein
MNDRGVSGWRSLRLWIGATLALSLFCSTLCVLSVGPALRLCRSGVLSEQQFHTFQPILKFAVNHQLARPMAWYLCLWAGPRAAIAHKGGNLQVRTFRDW